MLLLGYSDPFVTLAIGERQKEKTKVITKHLNPVWTDEIFSFTSDNPSRDKVSRHRPYVSVRRFDSLDAMTNHLCSV